MIEGRSLLRHRAASRLAVPAVFALLGIACSRAPAPDAYGNVEATEVVVGAETAGRLMRFDPVEGARLLAGQRVALVDTTALGLQLQQVYAQRAAAGSHVSEVANQIDALEVQHQIAERAYARTRRLFDQKAATAQQLDQAERDYRVLGEQIQGARAQQRSAGEDATSTAARVAQIRDQIARGAVSNPVTGTVLATYTRAGEFVQPGQALYKIANLDTLELRAYVTEPQLGHIRIGQSATVTVDAAAGAPRRQFPGTVSWISSDAEFTPTPIQTRDERRNLVYAVKVRVPNREGILKIGMPADVVFAAASGAVVNTQAKRGG